MMGGGEGFLNVSPSSHWMDAVNRETMDQYFALLKDVMEEHSLFDKPSQIYNVDESGVPLDPRSPNIVATKGSRKVRYRVSGRDR